MLNGFLARDGRRRYLRIGQEHLSLDAHNPTLRQHQNEAVAGLAYDDVKAGRIPSHDTYKGREHSWWKGAKEYRVPGRPDSDRILVKELPNGVKAYGWTSTHYTKIQRFSGPHFPDSGWNKK
ncbi:hypothetical protein GCM10010252_40730 [Streptomyces aureoverticillatus]|nr:hypothetical protein GCM10010252_40730 [Streptomyces aureoverticillatus]